MPSTTATTFVCVVCYDGQQGHPAFQAGNDCMCKPCFDQGIKPQFEEHLRNEFGAPKWAGVIIGIDHVKSNFTPEFVGQYKAKMQESAILPNRRIYCAGRVDKPCGTFAGSKDEMLAAACGKCGTVTCGKCGSRIETHANEHECAERNDDASAFDGLQRGKDYQLCPQCATPSEIMDGCNHMTCGLTACGTEYCFICGDKAKEREGHWDVGKPCPKYNHPGDGNAIYEDPEEEDDFDDMFVEAQIDEDIHNLNMRLQMDLQNDVGLNRVGEAPELILRRADRQVLITTRAALFRLFRWDTTPAAPDWMTDLVSLADSLLMLLQVYTLSTEPDWVQDAWQRRAIAELPALNNAIALCRANSDTVAANFPGFLEVVNRWELAVAGAEGWQVEFRRQLEALRAAHMNQTASSKPSHSTSIFVIPLHFLIRNLTPPRSS